MVVPIVEYALLNPKEFVLLCADILESEGFKEVRVVEGSGDWKEDISANEILSSQSGIFEVLNFKVQCKHYAKSSKNISPDEVNEMFPYLFSTDANRLLIITDTDLTTQAKKEIEAFNKKNPIKKVIYWIQRDVDNRLLKHRWIMEKYFPHKNRTKERQTETLFNPYKLLDFFRETDSQYFFGREVDVKKLAESVYKNKTIILFGESGVGKTSLLHAGLFPLLRQENWIIISIRCLDNPVESIHREVLVQISLLNDPKIDFANVKEMTNFGDFLSNLSQISNSSGLRILIVVDQAEELFTLCDEEDRNTFSNGLTVFLTSNEIRGNFALLLSLRDDYIGDLRSWARSKVSLDSAFSWDGLHCIGRFTSEKAKLAIVEPTRGLNVTYEDPLIEQLLNDLLKIGNGFVYQPYLQIVCSTLFDEAMANYSSTNSLMIGLESYEKLNRAMGIISAFFSEKLWVGFSHEEQIIARNVVKSLTTSEGLRHQLTHQQLIDMTGQRNDDITLVLKRLVDKRLVHRIIVEQADEPVYELIHDFLGKQIANQLSDEERHCKEAEELLSEAFRRWKKHGTILNEHEITVLEEYSLNLRFDEQQSVLIFTSLLDKKPDWLVHKKWFDAFGDSTMTAFTKAYLGTQKHSLVDFDKVVNTWNDKLVSQLIETIDSCSDYLQSDEKTGEYLELFHRTKNSRILNDPKVLNLALNFLRPNLKPICLVNALEILLSTEAGLDRLRGLGENALQLMVDTIDDGWYYTDYWYGTPTWFSKYKTSHVKAFIEMAQTHKPFVIALLKKEIWNARSARRAENLVAALSFLSDDVEFFHKILTNHWKAYAQLAAVNALTKIGSEEATNALVDGLSSDYSTVLREILIALGRLGNESALPALEKVSEKPYLSESNIGYLQKTIDAIKSKTKEQS